jgi:E3 ubiquitin-protein ligase DOA10
MEGFPHEVYSEETPPRESVPIQVLLQRLVGSLAPEQRLILSIFLFMDVCILSFAVLFLFNKIALPF